MRTITMRTTFRTVLAAVVLLHGADVLAQRPISLSLAGGLSAPQGDLGNGADLGWHALGAINVSSMMLPLGLRLEGAYNRFQTSDAIATSLGSGHQSVISITGNATYRLPMTNSPLSPYLIAGMGAYRTNCSGCEGSTSFGWNAGLGTKLYFLGFRSFLEARFHSTERGRSSVNYFPVTFGITF
jgi:hypothetical protein